LIFECNTGTNSVEIDFFDCSGVASHVRIRSSIGAGHAVSYGSVHFCSRAEKARHEVPNGTLGDGVSFLSKNLPLKIFSALRSVSSRCRSRCRCRCRRRRCLLSSFSLFSSSSTSTASATVVIIIIIIIAIVITGSDMMITNDGDSFQMIGDTEAARRTTKDEKAKRRLLRKRKILQTGQDVG
jgi:hypothetical protein